MGGLQSPGVYASVHSLCLEHDDENKQHENQKSYHHGRTWMHTESEIEHVLEVPTLLTIFLGTPCDSIEFSSRLCKSAIRPIQVVIKALEQPGMYV